MNRSNRQQAQLETFLIADGNQSLVASGDVAGSGNALNIANLQLGVISEDPNGTVGIDKFIPASTSAADVKEVKIAQGTPYSSQTNKASAFGHTHKPIVKSSAIVAGNVRSVTTNVFEFGRYSIIYITGLNGLVAGKRYQLNVTLESQRNDLMYQMARQELQASVTMPDTLPAEPADYFLQNLGLTLNKNYSKFADQSNSGFSGRTPFVALGVDTAAGAGEVIGGITRATSIDFAQYTINGSATTLNLASDVELVNSLNAAVGSVAALSTDTFPVLGSVTPGTASTVDGLMLIAFHDEPVADDTLRTTALTMHVGLGLIDKDGTAEPTFTQTLVSSPSEGIGIGRNVALSYAKRAQSQVFSLENHPSQGRLPLLPPNYISESLNYTETVIEFYEKIDTPGRTQATAEAKAVILLPAVADDLDADVDAGFTYSTEDSTTVTSLNNTLSNWLNTGANLGTIDYLGKASAGTVFV